MDLICYSHLRWNFVYQRPQHLMSRFAKQFRVFYIEEPFFDDSHPHLDTQQEEENTWIVVPHLPAGMGEQDINNTLESLLKELFNYFGVTNFIAWYYTPMALGFSSSFTPALVVYDCMDELSAFRNAPADLQENEKKLLQKADIVFTGGYSLYEAKKGKYSHVHLFPSSIDRKHFSKARMTNPEMHDQQNIPHPRIGFFGVIDERMDLALLDELATKKPDWHFILIGPVVKIDPATLPAHANIHYMGQKTYKELPWYISGWDVAMMPFAINASTRFISPTKTPEYLAAGKPVVSTAIHDVVKSYGNNGLVRIANTGDEFINGIQDALTLQDRKTWLQQVDSVLAQNSWDMTCKKMSDLITACLQSAEISNPNEKKEHYV